jgi:hypothetical protein
MRPRLWLLLSVLLLGGCRGPDAGRNAAILADPAPVPTAEQQAAHAKMDKWSDEVSQCLPAVIDLNFVVNSPLGGPSFTVEQRLRQMGAQVREGKLVDADGKLIYDPKDRSDFATFLVALFSESEKAHMKLWVDAVRVPN